jgi:hypothetical protein
MPAGKISSEYIIFLAASTTTANLEIQCLRKMCFSNITDFSHLCSSQYPVYKVEIQTEARPCFHEFKYFLCITEILTPYETINQCDIHIFIRIDIILDISVTRYLAAHVLI